MTRILTLLISTLWLLPAPLLGMAGDGFTIERVEVRGNDRTKSNIILRALTFESGDILTEAAINEGKEALYQTRLFTTVHLASKPGTKKEHAIVVVYVDEKRFGDLGISFDYTELDGFGISADTYHVNVGGEGKTVDAAWGAGERFKQWRFGYADPWLTSANFLFSVGISGSSADRDLFRAKDSEARGRYDLERIGGRVALGHSVSRYNRLLLRYRFEEVQVGEFDRPTIVTDRSEFADEVGFAVGRERLAYIGLDFHKKPSPEPWGSIAGIDYRIAADLSTKWIGSSDTFLKIDAHLYGHVAVHGRQILSAGVRTGAVIGSEPFYERFFLDGDKQLRGNERREIGPEGGEEFVSGELTFSLPFHEVGRAYTFVEGAAVRRGFVTGSRTDQGATAGVGVILFKRIDISLGLSTGTLVVKSHRFGGINFGL
jgi:outer membrane protein insertion porin family